MTRRVRFVSGELLGPRVENLEVRMGQRIKPRPDGCWSYNGRPMDRYAKVALAGASSQQAHRALYEAVRGPLDPGVDLHHTCGNKGCVNVAHLEPMTHAEHMTRHAEMRR